MTDLTFCYQHMSDTDIQTLDTLDSSDYMDGQLSDEELEIPPHMVPPDPDDADTLPSQVHPSYPYGNPTNLNHPAALPHIHREPGRALYEDMVFGGGGVNAALRWKDLSLDMLLPVNEEKEEAERAALARKMASGATQSNHAPPSVPEEQPNEEDEDTDSADGGIAEEDDEDHEEEDGDEDDDEDDEDEDENDENDISQDSIDSIMNGDSD